MESMKISRGIRKSKGRQYYGHKKKDKRTNKDLQNTTQKTKDRATRTPLKTGNEYKCYGRVGSSCSLVPSVVLFRQYYANIVVICNVEINIFAELVSSAKEKKTKTNDPMVAVYLYA